MDLDEIQERKASRDQSREERRKAREARRVERQKKWEELGGAASPAPSEKVRERRAQGNSSRKNEIQEVLGGIPPPREENAVETPIPPEKPKGLGQPVEEQVPEQKEVEESPVVVSVEESKDEEGSPVKEDVSGEKDQIQIVNVVNEEIQPEEVVQKEEMIAPSSEAPIVVEKTTEIVEEGKEEVEDGEIVIENVESEKETPGTQEETAATAELEEEEEDSDDIEIMGIVPKGDPRRLSMMFKSPPNKSEARKSPLAHILAAPPSRAPPKMPAVKKPTETLPTILLDDLEVEGELILELVGESSYEIGFAKEKTSTVPKRYLVKKFTDEVVMDHWDASMFAWLKQTYPISTVLPVTKVIISKPMDASLSLIGFAWRCPLQSTSIAHFLQSPPCPLGRLASIRSFSWKTILNIALQSVQLLSALYATKGVSHAAFSPHSVLVEWDDDLQLRVMFPAVGETDNFTPNCDAKAMVEKGIVTWCAPEHLSRDSRGVRTEHIVKGDIFGMGALLWGLMAGYDASLKVTSFIYNGGNPNEFSELLQITGGASLSALGDTIVQALQKDPTMRPTPSKLLQLLSSISSDMIPQGFNCIVWQGHEDPVEEEEASTQQMASELVSPRKNLEDKNALTLHVATLTTFELERALEPIDTRILCAVHVEDEGDGQVWVGTSDGSIIVHGDTSERLQFSKQAHHADVVSLVYVPETQTVWSVSLDKHIKVWKKKTCKLLKILQCPGEGTPSHMIQVGEELFVGSSAGSLYAIHQETYAIRLIRNNNFPVHRLLYHGGTIWAGCGSFILLLDPTEGDCKEVLEGHEKSIHGLIAVGETVWSGSLDENVCVWSMEGKLLSKVRKHTASIHGLEVYNESCVWSGGMDRRVIVWDAHSKREVQQLKGMHSDCVSCMVKVYDKMWTCGWDGKIFIWKSQ